MEKKLEKKMKIIELLEYRRMLLTKITLRVKDINLINLLLGNF